MVFLGLCVYVPVGRLAGTHKAAAAGEVEPFDAARYSRDAADGGEPREPRPGCNGPAEELKRERDGDVLESFFIVVRSTGPDPGTQWY